MNRPKEFVMACEVKPCRLNGDSIEEIRGLPITAYNPFDYYSKGDKELYLQFIAVDENDPQDIFKFISKYGFLGFGHDKDCIYDDTMKLITESGEMQNEMFLDYAILAIKEGITNPKASLDAINMLKMMRNNELPSEINDQFEEQYPELPGMHFMNREEFMGHEPLESENISNIAREIVIMRSLVSLWQALRTKNRENVISQMANLYQIKHKDNPNLEVPLEELVASKINFDGLLDDVVWFRGSELLASWVDQKLSGVTPMLGNFNENLSFSGLWYTPHLLSAMHVMLYMDLTRGIMLKKCQNQTCKQFFSMNGADERKVYCSESCAKAQAQREYRRRKKEQELK